MIAASCYALLAIAWIVDLATPQLFVAAVLLNGPIALSSLALRPSLTIRLTILAEIANVVAAYANGLQAGHRWLPVALDNRALVAATFVLVGYLTIRAQDAARRAGETAERERQVRDERSLRHALESVRATLSMELVLRAAARAACSLTGAKSASIFVRDSAFGVPVRYEAEAAVDEVKVRREPLDPELASALARSAAERRLLEITSDHALSPSCSEPALVSMFRVDDCDVGVAVTWIDPTALVAQRSLVQALLDNLEVALRHVRLVARLEEQHARIAAQNEEIAARGEVIRDIVYALAHDLRTPLAAADLTMRQAIEGAYGELPSAYRGILRASVVSNADLRRMVETLLLVARYESGEDSRAFSGVDVGEVAGKVVDEMHEMGRVKGVQVSLHAAEPLALVADGDEIRRAIANLVANAIEATPSGGTVEVSVEAAASRAVVAVSDDGYGVSPERRASLFERFAGVRAGGGTGLGLYIVRRIAEKYGGLVDYAPREPRGSRFTIELPLGSP